MGKFNVITGLTFIAVGFQNCGKGQFSSELREGDSVQLSSSAVAPKKSAASSTTQANNILPSAQSVMPTSFSQTTTSSLPAGSSSMTSSTMPQSMPSSSSSSMTSSPSQSSQAMMPSTSSSASAASSSPAPAASAAPATASAPAEPVWLITSFQIEYGAPMKPLGPMTHQTNQGELMEAANRTLLKDTNRDAYYSDIVGNGWLIIEDPEKVSPSRVTVIECQRDAINVCRTHSVNPNDLSWSMAGMDNTYLLHSSFMCVNTGQSVAEKRGLIDCGAQGAGAFMISDRDPRLFSASVNMPTRGTLWSSNTRAFASGKFKVIAKILPTTPELGKFAGVTGEYEVTIKNRMDLQLSVNTGSIFESYGIPLVSVNYVTSEGPMDGVTYKSVNCNAMASNGESLVMEQRMYENRFSFKRAPASLPSGTTVKVSCSATTYDGQSASVAFEQTK